MAQQTFPENNLQDTVLHDNFIEKSIDYTSRFEQSLRDLQDAIGVSQLIPVSEGLKVKLYNGLKVTLADGNVPEGELIPLSKVEPQVAEEKEITLLKYRKSTTGEDIQKFGLDQAVDRTDMAMVKDVQKNIRKNLFDFIQTGEAQENVGAQKDFQGALATSWGALNTIFEDDTIRTVVFAHPLDVATAIANKQLSLETAFGLNYYTDVTGTIVFTSTQVAQGNVYATASENLVIAYVPTTSEVGQAFNLTSDNTGFIGMKHFLHEETLTHQTLMVSGVLMFPERLDGVIKVAIGDAATDGTETDEPTV